MRAKTELFRAYCSVRENKSTFEMAEPNNNSQIHSHPVFPPAASRHLQKLHSRQTAQGPPARRMLPSLDNC
jgi:hypothetical protein